jgi:hypothetical protein
MYIRSMSSNDLKWEKNVSEVGTHHGRGVRARHRDGLVSDVRPDDVVFDQAMDRATRFAALSQANIDRYLFRIDQWGRATS